MPNTVVPNSSALKPTEFASLDSLAFIDTAPALSATLKHEFADFSVDEQLGFEFSEQGEHICLRVEKTNHSTVDVVKKLSEVTGVRRSAIGYAGMKDRRAVSRQWFSVQLPQEQESVLKKFETDSLHVLDMHRNSRKIKIGSHKANHFSIRLRNCQGLQSKFEERLNRIIDRGVPNYFGSQRFGREFSNLTQVRALMESELGRGPIARVDKNISAIPRQRFKRGMLLSAARAYLFNQLLSTRLEQGSWNNYVAGDVLNLDGTGRSFVLKNGADWDKELQQRLQSFDIHITGLLPGLNAPGDKYISSGQAADIEEAVCEQFDLLVSGLRHFGLQSARRALRFRPISLQWQWLQSETREGAEGGAEGGAEEGHDLLLDFSLTKGAYATSLLRELCATAELPQLTK